MKKRKNQIITKILLLVLLLPALVFSQNNESKKSLTPYADIEFEDGVVVYTVGRNTALLFPRLKPTIINMELTRLKFSFNNDNVSGEYIKKSQKAIRSYVNSEPVSQLSKKDKLDYLKLCALLVIWDNELSDHAVTELEKLTVSSNNEIKENAELLGELLVFYREYGKNNN